VVVVGGVGGGMEGWGEMGGKSAGGLALAIVFRSQTSLVSLVLVG